MSWVITIEKLKVQVPQITYKYLSIVLEQKKSCKKKIPQL